VLLVHGCVLQISGMEGSALYHLGEGSHPSVPYDGNVVVMGLALQGQGQGRFLESYRCPMVLGRPCNPHFSWKICMALVHSLSINSQKFFMPVVCEVCTL